MDEAAALSELTEFAESYREDDALAVRRAVVALDENSDGEPMTRLILLLPDPDAETWSVDRVRELRLALGARATELDLPPVTLTLVPESERDEVTAFSA